LSVRIASKVLQLKDFSSFNNFDIALLIESDVLNTFIPNWSLVLGSKTAKESFYRIFCQLPNQFELC